MSSTPPTTNPQQSPSPSPPASPPVSRLTETVEQKIQQLNGILEEARNNNNNFTQDVLTKLTAINATFKNLKQIVEKVVVKAKDCDGATIQLMAQVKELEQTAKKNEVASAEQMDELRKLVALATDIINQEQVKAINSQIETLEKEVQSLTDTIQPAVPSGQSSSASTEQQVTSTSTGQQVTSTSTGTQQQKGGKKHKKTKRHRGGYHYKKKRTTRKSRR